MRTNKKISREVSLIYDFLGTGMAGEAIVSASADSASDEVSYSILQYIGPTCLVGIDFYIAKAFPACFRIARRMLFSLPQPYK